MTRRGGPYPHLRLNLPTKAEQGAQIAQLHGEGQSFREIAAATGLSVTTCWRRYWFYMDWTLPLRYGKPTSTIPPQRGTRACPAGRPWIKAVDEDRFPQPW